jgi:predicted DCC family thiol-disulfide oxidoreductase YuxK
MLTGKRTRDILFYDGECGLCHRAVKSVLRKDAQHVVDYAPLGGETFQALLTAEQQRSIPDSLVVLTPEGELLTRSTAALRLMSQLGGGSRFRAKMLRRLPMALRDWGYDWVARNRKRWFDKPADTCPLVSKELRGRFLP